MNRTGKMVFTCPTDDERSFVKTIKRGLSWITETKLERDDEFPENEWQSLSERKVKITNLCESVPQYLHRRANEAMRGGWHLDQPPTIDELYWLKIKLNKSPKSMARLMDAVTACSGASFVKKPETYAFVVLDTCVTWQALDDHYVLEVVADRYRLLQLWVLLDYGINGSEEMEIWGRDPMDPAKRIGSRHRKGPVCAIQSNMDWIASHVPLDTRFKHWMEEVGYLQRPIVSLPLEPAFPRWQFAM